MQVGTSHGEKLFVLETKELILYTNVRQHALLELPKQLLCE